MVPAAALVWIQCPRSSRLTLGVRVTRWQEAGHGATDQQADRPDGTPDDQSEGPAAPGQRSTGRPGGGVVGGHLDIFTFFLIFIFVKSPSSSVLPENIHNIIGGKRIFHQMFFMAVQLMGRRPITMHARYKDALYKIT